MAIPEKDILVGWEYQAGDEQDRVVLGCDDKGKVVYASRGGRVKNQYTHRQAASLGTFADACTARVRQLPKDEFDTIFEACHAKHVVVPDSECGLGKG